MTQLFTTLNNGITMPLLGLGVYDMYKKEAEEAVTHALEIGYRLIDTAAMYKNETEIGNAIRASAVPRKEIFLTTKVADGDQGYDNTLHAFDERQADYYANAGRYLGLIEPKKSSDVGSYALTSKATEILGMNQRNRQLALAKLIVGHEAFGNTLRLYLKQTTRPTKEQVIAIMKQAQLNRVEAESTIARRASTVLAWVDWVIELTKR